MWRRLRAPAEAAVWQRMPAHFLPPASRSFGQRRSHRTPVTEAIASVTGVLCDLRWPNDLLAGGRKCAGILCQTAASAGARNRRHILADADRPPAFAGRTPDQARGMRGRLLH